MNLVTCNLGCSHLACEICGATDPTAGVINDYWPFGVMTSPDKTMTTCLSCRNKVWDRIDTVGKVRLLIGLEQRPSTPADTLIKPAIPDTDVTQVLPVSFT